MTGTTADSGERDGGEHEPVCGAVEDRGGRASVEALRLYGFGDEEIEGAVGDGFLVRRGGSVALPGH